MALTAEEQEKIRQLLARESEQNRNKHLSSLENFAKFIEVVARIAIAAKHIADLFVYCCSFFG